MPCACGGKSNHMPMSKSASADKKKVTVKKSSCKKSTKFTFSKSK